VDGLDRVLDDDVEGERQKDNLEGVADERLLAGLLGRDGSPH
jgi:hypothetical protein